MSETSKLENPLFRFGLIAASLVALRVLFAFVSVPQPLAPYLDILSSVLFVGLPIVGLFLGASKEWSLKLGLITVAIGVAIQLGFTFLGRGQVQGVTPVLLQSIAQTGLLIWCLGAGACVACLIKEKNLIIPVALFLAGFDAFLVLTPTAPTAKIVENHPEIFQSVASEVPKARVIQPTGQPMAKIVPLAFIGPADFLFTAVFFCLIFRFKLRAAETVKWLVPVMILYLAIVLSPFGFGMLPALVPIGATVLLVNRKEFNMTGEEKQATIAVGVIALGLASFGLYQRVNYHPAQHVVLLPKAPAPAPAKPLNSPAPAGAGQHP